MGERGGSGYPDADEPEELVEFKFNGFSGSPDEALLNRAMMSGILGEGKVPSVGDAGVLLMGADTASGDCLPGTST